ncbi:MAG: M28 family peptidase [Lentisphaerae bacterium]|jgi:hypothetical protein|nr:M28 family peptidase [Lentisphaerota bacterium]MBT5611938.1 M28 family peptidase [Lentisphaerota bacterium]MBT7057908.1 M28 family peptidase [Lentisphaerota bacterium]MBT7843705.1 M28 family peptidase [Lentisphaerota bacterium]
MHQLNESIREILDRVDPERMRGDLFSLARDPLPCRRANVTLPGHDRSTLDEADDLISSRLESWGCEVLREPAQVQAYRCDTTKHPQAQYSPPVPEDPWYTVHNLHATRNGTERPDEIIMAIAHKDSQSWVDSPGAGDNAIGAVGVMEMARVLARVETARTVRFMFCNEEHTPWTSRVAAENAQKRGDRIIAVFNTDGIGRKSPEDNAAGKKTNVTKYTTPEGRALGELLCEVNALYGIGLDQSLFERPAPGDDDGSFVTAGFGAAVMNIGCNPSTADPNYHTVDDLPELVDVDNAAMTVRMILGAILTLDES